MAPDMRRFLLMLFLLLGWILPSLTQVIHIPTGQPTIQAGILAAGEGDTVLIDEGTYFEQINFLGKAITVASRYLVDGDTSHITRTIINGSRSTNPDTASVVTMWSGEDTTSILCGLTITGGSGTFVRNIHDKYFNLLPRVPYYAGGGILIHHSGGKIIHNIVEQNHMSFKQGVRGTMGIGILAVVDHHHHAVIRNNIIRNNSSTQNRVHGHGGGIAIVGGGVLVEHNFILDNLIDVDGMAAAGGIYFEYAGAEGTVKEVTIRNNQISGNRTYSHKDFAGGGGIALANGLDSVEVRIFNNMIAQNETGNVGGGIYSFLIHKGRIYSNLIFNNTAGLYGVNIGTEDQNNLDMKYNQMWTGDHWIATYDGLARIILGPGKITGFHPPEGIRIEPFHNFFSIDPATGELHFGEREGMIAFIPEKVPVNGFLAPSVIVDYHTYREQEADPLKKPGKMAPSKNTRLDLPLGNTFMIYKMGTLDFSGSSDSSYLYFMKGIDEDTLRASFLPFYPTYGGLRRGRYTFWTSGGDQGSPHRGIALDIRVGVPWYRSGPVIAGYAIVLLLLVFGLLWIRTSRLKRERDLLEVEVSKRTAELREKNEQIVEMEQLKSRFFTDIAHEIRTPLSLIMGPLENLLRSELGGEKEVKWLEMARRNSQRLMQLVNQLLDVSRLDAGHMKLVLERSDLLKHLRILVNEYRSLAESRKVGFVIDIPEIELISWYDREKIQNIASNLLSNAFKFTPARGTVTCRVKILERNHVPGNPALRIIVADTGPGIPMKEREHIFKRFYRADSNLYDDASGTGIGLALAKEYIELMHGTVIVKSLVGTGAVFIVTLPLGKEHLDQKEYILKEIADSESRQGAGREETPSASLPAMDEDQRMEVLIVEDNQDLRTFIRENLSPSYLVTEADNGIAGLDLALEHIPDLVIMDLMMPGMDGMELCKKLKSNERTSHIPVIMLTAKATGKDKIEGFEHGADDYIFKPFSVDELSVRIVNLMEQRERLKEKYSRMIGMDWGVMTVTTLDEQFLKKVTGYIMAHLQDFDLNVNALKEKMSMSREHLYRKLKALTGESPSNLIKVIRLKAAAGLIEAGEQNITRISLNTGFSNPSYFARCFKEYFGKTPAEYRKSLKKPAGYNP